MLVVVALGGNALLRRGEQPDAATQEANVTRAVRAIAALARDHDVVLTHGNGPQVGLLALESEQDKQLSRPYPLDVLGAETEGMVGYWLERELVNALPTRQVTAVLTQTVVSQEDPAFTDPTKFVGQVYDQAAAATLGAERNWVMKPDGAYWRRVVPSPRPLDFVELPVIRQLVEAGVIVVCAGGGGVPVVRTSEGLRGVEAVVDKDAAAALLAGRLGADALLMLTDVPAVQADFGTPAARDLRRATSEELRRLHFPAGSMGPKIEAACAFVEGGGRLAAIGALDDAPALLRGEAGTLVLPAPQTQAA